MTLITPVSWRRSAVIYIAATLLILMAVTLNIFGVAESVTRILLFMACLVMMFICGACSMMILLEPYLTPGAVGSRSRFCILRGMVDA